jgi:hypothetical protein
MVHYFRIVQYASLEEIFMATQTTIHQLVNFVQRKIAETHAEGEDILSLLADPQVAFCLQILDGTYAHSAPSITYKNNRTLELEELHVLAGTHSSNGQNQTLFSNF